MPKRNQRQVQGGGRVISIDNPHIVVFSREGELETDILHKPGDRYATFGIMVADIVRHIANAFKVEEKFVWLWVDKERYKPTSPITEIHPIPRRH